jgi:hypothetical protein
VNSKVSDLVPTPKHNRVAKMQALFDSVKPTRSSKNSRVEGYKKANLFQVRAMRAAVSNFANKLGFVDVVEERTLTRLELQDLMDEYKALKESSEIAEARRERIRDMLYTHFDLTGNEDQTAEIEVDGKLFKREGGGTKDPTFDVHKIKSAFSTDWDYKEFITETIVESVDTEALERFLERHPEDIEKVRAALIPGQRSSFKFAVRDVVEDGDE